MLVVGAARSRQLKLHAQQQHIGVRRSAFGVDVESYRTISIPKAYASVARRDGCGIDSNACVL